MSVFTKPIEEITFSDIKAFCERRIRENVRLDYKRDFSERNANKQIAKEIAAMANTQGGVIIFGVDEKEKKPITPIVGMDKGESLERLEGKVTSIALSSIYPPVIPEVKACEVENDSSKAVIVIRVMESDETPHSIEGRTEFYIRADDICDPRRATLEEIEWLQNRRQKAVDLRQQLIKRATERSDMIFGTGSAVDPPETYYECFSISVIPFYPTKPLMKRTELPSKMQECGILSYGDTYGRGNGKIKSCHESVISVGSSREEYDNEDRHDVNELNIFGMLYHRDNRAFQRSPRGRDNIIWLNILITEIYLVLESANKLYENLGYRGLIQVGLELNGIWGKEMYDDTKQGIPLCPPTIDHNISLKRKLTATELRENCNDCVLDLCENLLWDLGIISNAREIANARLMRIKSGGE